MIYNILLLLGLCVAFSDAQVEAPSVQISAGPVVPAVDNFAAKMLVTTDSIGICINGTVTNVQRLNPVLGMSVPGATATDDCSSYALGETLILGHNGTHLNVYDTNTNTVSSSVFHPGATSWKHTGLLPNNQRFASCVMGSDSTNKFNLYTINGNTITAHENSTLWNQTCVAGGVVATDIGEDIFLMEGNNVHFASMEDRDDGAVVYVNERIVVVNSSVQVIEAKAAYSSLVMVRNINDDVIPIYADGTGTWTVAQPINHGLSIQEWDVSKTDGTLFIKHGPSNMTVFTRVDNEWVNQGTFNTPEEIIQFDSLALNQLYWYEELGALYDVQASVPTAAPTLSPTLFPTDAPSVSPSVSPTGSPTNPPTNTPTTSPSTTPTDAPTTASPTKSPTVDENVVDGTTLGVIFGSVVGATIVGIIVYNMWANWGASSGAVAISEQSNFHF